MQEFKVGIRFQPLTKGKNEVNREHSISRSHWVLVLTPANNPAWSCLAELRRGPNSKDCDPRASILDEKTQAFPLCTWMGILNEIFELFRVHPMTRTSYSAAWNNCQHWAATMLIYMQASPKTEPGRVFNIINWKLYKRVLKVIKQDGDKLYHDSNLLFEAAHLMSIGGAAGVAGTAAVAAGATTTVILPAAMPVATTGPMAIVHVATTVPTAGAIAGTLTLPVAALGTVALGTLYLYKNKKWRKKTTFDDPR
jgi:hypothetical protein